MDYQSNSYQANESYSSSSDSSFDMPEAVKTSCCGKGCGENCVLNKFMSQ